MKFPKLILPTLNFQKRHITIPVFATLAATVIFAAGYILGAYHTLQIASEREQQLLTSQPTPTPTPILTPTPTHLKQPATRLPTINYTGPQLWEAVNKARVEHGVSPLSGRDALCTIAAIRLSQIRELGKLDGHAGFDAVVDRVKNDPGLPNNISEFLISGYPTADQAVSAWLDTLGHKKLITGGEYRWGCVYAADGFGVAITGF